MSDATELALPALALKINEAMTRAHDADVNAKDQRIAAGMMLKRARERVAPKQWTRWLKRNITRSKADVYRCLALVENPKPEAQAVAREAEKTKARTGMRASRAKATTREALSPTLETRERPTPATMPNTEPRPTRAVWDKPVEGLAAVALLQPWTETVPFTSMSADSMIDKLSALVKNIRVVDDMLRQAQREHNVDQLGKAFVEANKAIGEFGK